MFDSSVLRRPALALMFALAAACASPRQTHMPRAEVPVNSLAESRLHAGRDEGREREGPRAERTPVPTTTREKETAERADDRHHGQAGKPRPLLATRLPDPTPDTSADAPGAASPEECERAMAKQLDLELRKTLKNAPRATLEAAKKAAREQKGDTSCTATKAQTTCAMAAKTIAAWQKCMK